MNYHLAKKLTPSTSKQSTVCLCCEKEFPGCYSLQQPRREEYGAIQPKSSDTLAELNKIVEEEGDDGEKPKEEFTQFISKSGYDSENFCGVSIDDLPLEKEKYERNIFIYDFDFQEGEYDGELARRSIGKFEKTVKLLRFNNHIIHTNGFDSFFWVFGFPSCYCLINRSNNINWDLMTFNDRVFNTFKFLYQYPRNW